MKLACCLCLLPALLSAPVSYAADTIAVAVVTGGHGFTEKPFLDMFRQDSAITFTHIALKDDSEIFETIDLFPYDVVVLYNLTQKISEKRRANFLALMDRGVGLVVLHHAIANYADWPEYREIIGARYFLKDITENGVTYPASQYEHGVDIAIHVEDVNHPVTRGVKDFQVNDETYKGYTLAPDNHVLLTTDNPKSERVIGWTRQYRQSRVCFFQMGHGDSIFGDASYRRLVAQAIAWTAGKP